jgi:predicted dehydrogenase/threonine dehydrogenase-like Zn-dependent dehydrogenase
MKQVLVGRDGVSVEEVAAPALRAGAVLVRVEHSAISAGTELGGIQSSGKSLLERALERPEQVRAALGLAAREGIGAAWQAVRGRLGARQPLGYSVSGTVLEVGAGVAGIAPGDRVACAGSQWAFHAEIVCVPRNLVVPIPETVATDQAALVALGAIALQGVRRAAPTLGETFVVLGLGLVGQLTAQLLKANGVRVIGSDLDPTRLELARSHGLDAALGPSETAPVDHVMRLTGGVGADGVIIAAATSSSELVSTAFRMCRRRGRVVLVGDVGLDLKREDLYAKELDFLVSTSYGPGRYDPKYEEEGQDYPISHVRWTERRNMVAFLEFVSAGKIDVGALISGHFPIERAPDAYRALESATPRPLGVLLDYPARAEARVARVEHKAAQRARTGAVRLAIVGPGSFLRSTLLPILLSEKRRFSIDAVVARQGHAAAETARQCGARVSTTDLDAVLGDPEIDAVLIATRHGSHGALALKALQAGKHVMVEKPLTIHEAELDGIAHFYADPKGEGTAPILLTGFNRAFSKYVTAIGNAVSGRSDPMMIDYRVNAGYMPLDSWLHGPDGGGRNLGEACHFYHLFLSLVGSAARSIDARAIRPASGTYAATDNFSATIGFEDGSVASLTYTSLGARDYPKERFDVYAGGRVYSVDDFTKLATAGAKGPSLSSGHPDKGHREELCAFADAIISGGAWPIPLWQQLEAMRIAFEVERRIRPEGAGS